MKRYKEEEDVFDEYEEDIYTLDLDYEKDDLTDDEAEKYRYVHRYSVMQSDGNSFCGDVVFNSSLTWHTVMKTALWTKNMKSESFGVFIMKIYNFKSN